MSNDEIINQIFFEKYKTAQKLGQGSFGTVYLGFNIKTNEKVAMKFVRFNF
jgi:serine/threonine protein kinase